VVLGVQLWALRVPPLRAALIAVIATLVIHTAFYKLMRVPLPWGVLTPFAW
jgi:putative tricarboxylic transport membrane protein